MFDVVFSNCLPAQRGVVSTTRAVEPLGGNGPPRAAHNATDLRLLHGQRVVLRSQLHRAFCNDFQ